MKQMINVTKFCLVAVISCLSIGCGGGSDKPELGTVTGIVTMDDKPLANVLVRFQPDTLKTEGQPSSGLTDAEGKYELVYGDGTKGAAVMAHVVTITTPSDAPDPSGKESKDPIPAKYNTATQLKETVKAGENPINFDLKSK